MYRVQYYLLLSCNPPKRLDGYMRYTALLQIFVVNSNFRKYMYNSREKEPLILWELSAFMFKLHQYYRWFKYTDQKTKLKSWQNQKTYCTKFKDLINWRCSIDVVLLYKIGSENSCLNKNIHSYMYIHAFTFQSYRTQSSNVICTIITGGTLKYANLYACFFMMQCGLKGPMQKILFR